MLFALTPAVLAALISACLPGSACRCCNVTRWRGRTHARHIAFRRRKVQVDHCRHPATLLVAAAWTYGAVPLSLIGSAVLIAVVGLVDDIRPGPARVAGGSRGAVVFTAPETLRIVPALPLAVERIILLIGGVWFSGS